MAGFVESDCGVHFSSATAGCAWCRHRVCNDRRDGCDEERNGEVELLRERTWSCLLSNSRGLRLNSLYAICTPLEEVIAPKDDPSGGRKMTESCLEATQ